MIKIVDLYHSFNENPVLQGISLEVPKGEMLALIGRSGDGKSVLLKHVGGLLKGDRGRVIVGDEEISRLHGKALERLRRKFGFLFQTGALFDSLTIFDNVAFPLREKTRLKESRIRDLVFHELEQVGLRKDWKKYPAELSGGMKKRAALARALIMDPEIMLFDEPATGLDPLTTSTIFHYIKASHEQLKFTGILVTHQIPRAFSIVQKVAMLHHGRIVACTAPDKIGQHEKPVVRQFISGDISEPAPVGNESAAKGKT